jgi:hypothetical protein
VDIEKLQRADSPANDYIVAAAAEGFQTVRGRARAASGARLRSGEANRLDPTACAGGYFWGLSFVNEVLRCGCVPAKVR